MIRLLQQLALIIVAIKSGLTIFICLFYAALLVVLFCWRR